jgi:heat shock protein HslJ
MKGRWSMTRLWVVLLACGWSAQAQAPSSEAVADLSGPTWQLMRFQGSDDKTVSPDDKAKYTISFSSDGQASLRLDCNRGHGMWKSTARNKVEFGPIAMTRAMCPPGSLDGQIASQLSNVHSYLLRDGHLFLVLAMDSGVYEFEPMPSGSVGGVIGIRGPTLEKTNWMLTQLGDRAITEDAVSTRPTLTLDSDSQRASGSSGCNRMTGSYELTGDSLTFGAMAGTMMACIKGMDVEKDYLAALARVKKWQIKGQELVLLDGEGKVLARFEAQHT